MELEKLNLSARAFYVLLDQGITTIEELQSLEIPLDQVPGVGKKIKMEIERKLKCITNS